MLKPVKLAFKTGREIKAFQDKHRLQKTWSAVIITKTLKGT